MAAGAGFTNVHIDSDGVRRRIRLTDNIGGTVFMQLAFSPLLRKLGSPEVVIDKNLVTLIGAVYDGKEENISIPLDSSGMMLIRWPKNYQNSFTHVPFYLLIDYAESGEKRQAVYACYGQIKDGTSAPATRRSIHVCSYGMKAKNYAVLPWNRGLCRIRKLGLLLCRPIGIR